jgi:hypothetical protein
MLFEVKYYSLEYSFTDIRRFESDMIIFLMFNKYRYPTER